MGRAAGSLAEGYLLKEIERFHEQEETLRRLLAEEETSSGEQELEGKALEKLAKELSSFTETVAAMTVEQFRAAARGLVREIVWDG